MQRVHCRDVLRLRSAHLLASRVHRLLPLGRQSPWAAHRGGPRRRSLTRRLHLSVKSLNFSLQPSVTSCAPRLVLSGSLETNTNERIAFIIFPLTRNVPNLWHALGHNVTVDISVNDDHRSHAADPQATGCSSVHLPSTLVSPGSSSNSSCSMRQTSRPPTT